MMYFNRRVKDIHMNTPIELRIENDYNQFNLLDPKVFNISYNSEQYILDSANKQKEYVITTNNSPITNTMQRIISLNREHDLVYLSRLKDFGINVPRYIHTKHTNKYFKYMEPGKKYLLKPFYQARSLGQVVVNSENIFNMYNDSVSEMTVTEFNEKWDIDTSTAWSDVEKATAYNALHNSSFYISELIDIKKEFRILYFRGTKSKDYTLVEREGYLVNSGEERKATVIKKSKHITTKILDKIKEFGDSTEFCMLSFDVYIDKNGKWGIFEYSQEFGIANIGNYKKLAKQMNRAILKQIKILKEYNNGKI